MYYTDMEAAMNAIIRKVKRANQNGEFWFGFQDVDRTAHRVCFQATISRVRYTAYGTYESLDVYAVEHGPTQRDVDVISALLDAGWEPKSVVTE